MGVRPDEFRVKPSMVGDGRQDYYNLIPSLKEDALVWNCKGMALGPDLTTEGVAESLIKDLVLRYKATQVTR